MPSKKIQTDIYRIDLNSIFSELSQNLVAQTRTEYDALLQRMNQRDNTLTTVNVETFLNAIISFIMDEQNNNPRPDALHYNPIVLQNVDNLPYKLMLIKARTTPSNPIIALLDEKIPTEQLELMANRNTSCVLFAYNHKEMFAFCSGAGWHVIQKYIDQYFGLKVLIRLIPKDSPAITSAHNRGFTGTIAAQSINYRRNAKPREVIDFGKVCKDLAGRIQTEILQRRLNLQIDTTKKHINGNFKNSFRLRRKLSLQEILDLLDKITNFIDTEEPYFNLEEWLGISPLSETNQDKKLKNRAQNKLAETLYDWANTVVPRPYIDYFISNQDINLFNLANRFDIDIHGGLQFHKSYPDFSDCEDLSEFINDYCNICEIEDPLQKRQIIIEGIKRALLTSSEQHGDDLPIELTRGKLFEHIHGEIWDEETHQALIILDGVWYRVYDGLKQRLNNELPGLIRGRIIQTDLPHWGNTTEDEYIGQIVHNLQCCSLHKKRPLDNIEMCDVIRYENETLCLYHIKDSFNTTMRTLSAQVRSSATQLTDIQLSGALPELRRRWVELANETQNLPEWRIVERAISGEIPIKQRIVIKPSGDLLHHPEEIMSMIAKYELAALIKLWSFSMSLEIIIST